MGQANARKGTRIDGDRPLAETWREFKKSSLDYGAVILFLIGAIGLSFVALCDWLYLEAKKIVEDLME